LTIEQLIRSYVVTYEDDPEIVEVTPICAWRTGDVVELIELLDSELQRRYDEETRNAGGRA
jgi:hypothetical protein